MQKATKGNSTTVGILLNGFLNAILLTLLLIVLISLVFHFSSLSAYHFKAFSKVIAVLSVFWGGFRSARLAESKGLFHGVGVGVMYLLFTILLSALIAEPFNIASITVKTVYCLGAGAIGGVIGVSLK